MNGKTEVIRTRPKLGKRRERPHPLTHRASRLPWGRSRLSHPQRVTHSAASQSRSFGVVRQRSLHPVRERGRTRIKAPAKQPKTAPAQVRDGEIIEGVLGPWQSLNWRPSVERRVAHFCLTTGHSALRIFLDLDHVAICHRCGTIVVGQRADLLLVAGNPLENLAVLKRPNGVMVRGRWLPRQKLDELLKPLATNE